MYGSRRLPLCLCASVAPSSLPKAHRPSRWSAAAANVPPQGTAQLVSILLPEIVLVAVACAALFLLGVSNGPPPPAARRHRLRRHSPRSSPGNVRALVEDVRWAEGRRWRTVRRRRVRHYIKLLAAGVGVLLVLLAWPTNPDATGSALLDFGADAGEFFGLMLLSLAGVMLVAGRQRPDPAVPRHRAGQHPDLHHGLDLPPAAGGAGGGRQVLLPRRDGRRGDAVRLQLPLRHDRHDQARRDRRRAAAGRDAVRRRRRPPVTLADARRS